ncbi:MAG: hypothetical protein ACKOTZ_07070 [Chloroflexota bacterium]
MTGYHRQPWLRPRGRLHTTMALRPHRADRRHVPAVLTLAAIALGTAMNQWQRGEAAFHLALVIGIGLPMVAALLPGSLAALLPRRAWDRVTRSVLAVAIVAGALAIVTTPGILSVATGPMPGAHLAVGVVAALGIGSLTVDGRRGTFMLAGMTVVFFALGIWLIASTPDPRMDVYEFLRDGSRAIAQGFDPYGITFPATYPDPRWYGPGLIEDGRLLFGYPYPPVSLVAYVPSTVLTGDPRYGNLMALALASLLIGTAHPSRTARGAAALLLCTPSTYFVLELAWIEPIVALTVAACAWVACRNARGLGVTVGVLAMAKQYCLIAVPLAVMLLPEPITPRSVLRTMVVACVTMALIAGPFLLWGASGFIFSVYQLQTVQPFRPDSLGLRPVIADLAGLSTLYWLPFVATGMVMVLGLRLLPWTPSGYAWALAGAFGTFFVLSKQAFPNYYIAVIACLCASIATSGAREEELIPTVRATRG